MYDSQIPERLSGLMHMDFGNDLGMHQLGHDINRGNMGT